MRHHFTLTFKAPERSSVDVNAVASQIEGSDFHVERGAFNGGEFSVHFVREGKHAVDLLEFAKAQVLSAVPGSSLVAMEMAEEPPMMGVVDDITKLVIKACQVFPDPELAHAWLSSPQDVLGGAIPKVMMTEAEGRLKVAKSLQSLADNKH